MAESKSTEVDTAESLADQISKSKTSSIIHVRGVGDFTFNLQTGDDPIYNYESNRVGGVTNSLPPEIIKKFEGLVKEAVSLVAKRELLNRLNSLDDEKISKIISKNTSQMTDLSHDTVKTALKEMIIKQGRMGGIGIFTRFSNRQVVISNALKNGGVESITNMGKVEEIWRQIQPFAKQKIPKRPIQSF